MKKFSKIIDYIVNNKLYLTVMIIGFLLLLIQMNNVVLYADDFSLKIYSKGGILSAINFFVKHYMTWGGGFVSSYVIILLMFDISIWCIITCIIILIFIVLVIKLVSNNKKINKGILATILWALIFIVNIFVSRETLFWLDGCVAYVFNSFQVFIYIYMLYTRIFWKVEKKYDIIILPIVAFFSGWSSAQTGALAAIIPLIMLFISKFIKKEKIKKIFIIAAVFSIVGFMIFYFAPGNWSRMAVFDYFSNLDFLHKIAYRSNEIYGLLFNFIKFPFTGIPFYLFSVIVLSSIIALKFVSTEKNKKIFILVKYGSIFQLMFFIVCFIIYLRLHDLEFIYNYILNFKNLLFEYENKTLALTMLVPYLICTIVIIINILITIYISKIKKDPLLFIVVISAYVFQFIMFMAPYSPFRTAYGCIIFLLIAVIYLINIAIKEKIDIKNISIMLIIMISLKFGFILLFISLIFAFTFKKNKYEKLILILILLVFLSISLKNYYTITKNYNINKKIYIKNIERINECKNDMYCKQINILYPKYELYGFSSMVGVKWIEDAIRDYFCLDQDLKFIIDKNYDNIINK